MSAAPRATVLVVDDSGMTRTVLCMALQRAGYACVVAQDGQQALGLLTGVDAIVCDLHMPVMDGMAFLQRLRQNGVFQHLPFFFVSVEARQEERDAARRLGATGWMSKPVDAKAMIAALEKVLQRSAAVPQAN